MADHSGTRNLSGGPLIGLLILLGAIPPLSTDMYLSALPSMAGEMQVSVAVINLTFTVFLIFMGASMLVFGPLSDKYGRRPVLIAGTLVYSLASFGCALSVNMAQLIPLRAIEAIGGGAAVTVSLAVMRDAFTYRRRAVALAIAGTVIALAPALAPMLGAGLLSFTSWRVIFVFLGVFGVLGHAGCWLMRESLLQRSTDHSTVRQILRLLVVLRNPHFSWLLTLFSLMSMFVLGYIGISASIYVTRFQQSAQVFSYYFAANALLLLLGPMLYLVLSRRLGSLRVITMCLVAVITTGALLVTLGGRGPVVFTLCLLPGTLGNSVMRPPSTNLMLEQQEVDVGAASSLITCSWCTFGAVGLALLSLDQIVDKVLALGICAVLVGSVALAIWLVTRSRIRVPALEPTPHPMITDPDPRP